VEQLLIALAALLVAATPIVISWLRVKLGPQRLAAVNSLAQLAVNAAEKLGEAEPAVTNADKYQTASKFLVAASKRVGVKLTEHEANTFIQSSLRDLEKVEAGLNAMAPR
jgi:Tfp pilus assembly protein PilX